MPMPLSGGDWVNTAYLESEPIPEPNQEHHVNIRFIGPDYFSTLDIPVHQGRPLTTEDNADGQPAIVVNTSAANRFWPDQSPGRTAHLVRPARCRRRPLVYGGRRGGQRSPFGTRERHRAGLLSFCPSGRTVLCHHRAARVRRYHHFGRSSARSGTPPRPEPGAPPRTVGSYAGRRFGRRAPLQRHSARGVRRFSAHLGGNRCLWRCLLRGEPAPTRIRCSHRARCPRRRDHFVGVAPRHAAGTRWRRTRGGAALAATRLLASLVYGIRTTDPATYIVVGGTLTAVAIAACLVPAWRATRVDPILVLRDE